jgi:hypothetical protein
MSYYVLAVNDVDKVSAETIIDTLCVQKIWIFREGAPLLRNLKMRDNALIYVCGNNRRYFTAEITLLSEIKTFSGDSKVEKLAENLGLSWMSMYAEIEILNLFKTPVSIKPLIQSLSFIKDKKNYGLNLRLPIISIPEQDHELIVKCAG